MSLALHEALATLQHAQARDGACASVVLLRLTKTARAYVRTRFVSDGDADDVAMDALIRVLRTDSPFRGASEFEARAYLRSVVRRTACDRRRRARREREVIERLAPSHDEHSTWSTPATPVLELCAALRSLATRYEAMNPGCAPLLETMDALGMLPWTARGALDEPERAASLGVTANTLQARRSRLRKSVAPLIDALGAALGAQIRQALKTLFAGERHRKG